MRGTPVKKSSQGGENEAKASRNKERIVLRSEAQQQLDEKSRGTHRGEEERSETAGIKREEV